MAVQGTDQSGLSAEVDYYFRYDIDDAGFSESSITADYGSGTLEGTKVEAVADVSGSLEGKYFLLNSLTVEYYVWMNKFIAEISAEAEVTNVNWNASSASGGTGGTYWTLNAVNDVVEYYIWFSLRTPATDAVNQIVHTIPTYSGQEEGTSGWALGSGYTYFSSYVSVAAVTPNKIILAGRDPATGYGAAAGRDYLSTISRFSQVMPTYTWNTTAITYNDVTKIAENKAFIIYVEGTDIKCVIADTTTEVISYGTPQTIATGTSSDQVKVSNLPGTENVAVVYNSSANLAFTGVCSVSGTTITVGTMAQITTLGAFNYYFYSSDIAGLDSNRYIIGTTARGAGDFDYLIYGPKVIVVDYDSVAGTVDYGDVYADHTTGTISYIAASISRIDSNRILFWYSQSGSPYNNKFYIVKIDGKKATFSKSTDAPTGTFPYHFQWQKVQVSGKYFSAASRSNSGYQIFTNGLIDGENITITEDRVVENTTTLTHSDLTSLPIESGKEVGLFISAGTYTNGSYVQALDHRKFSSSMESIYWNLDSTTVSYYVWNKYNDVAEVTDVILSDDLGGEPRIVQTSGYLSITTLSSFGASSRIKTIDSTTCTFLSGADDFFIGNIKSDRIDWVKHDWPPITTTNSSDITATSSTTLVAAWITGGSIYGAVGTFNNGNISWGNTSLASDDANTFSCTITTIDATHVVALWEPDPSVTSSYSVGTISGSTISWGSVGTLSYGRPEDSIEIDSTHVLAIFSPLNQPALRIGTYSGGTLTWSDYIEWPLPRIIDSLSTNGTLNKLGRVDSTRYLISTRMQENDGTTSGQLPAIGLISIDGSYNITFEDTYKMTDLWPMTSYNYSGPVYLGSNRFHFTWWDNSPVISYEFIGELDLTANKITGISLLDGVGPQSTSEMFVYPIDTDKYGAISALNVTTPEPVATTRYYGKENYNSKYWFISNPTTDYYVWYNRSGAAEVFDVKVIADDGEIFLSDRAVESSTGVIWDTLQLHRIGSTSYLLALYDGTTASPQSHVIGTISGDTITWATNYPFDNTVAHYDDRTVLISDTSFVTVYNRNNVQEYSIVGSISGTTITYGSATAINVGYDMTGRDYRQMALIRLDATHVLLLYRNASNHPAYSIATITGTSISWATEVVVEASIAYSLAAASLDTTSPSRFVIWYSDKIQLGEWNGTTLTLGLYATNIPWDWGESASQQGTRGLYVLDSTHFMAVGQRFLGSNYYDYLSMVTLESDYKGMSFGDWVQNSHSQSTTSYLSGNVTFYSSTKAVYTYSTFTGTYGYLRTIDIDGSYNITLGTPESIQGNFASQRELTAPISATKYAMLYQNSNTLNAVGEIVGDTAKSRYNNSYFEMSAPSTDYYTWISAPIPEVTKLAALSQGPRSGTSAALTASTSYYSPGASTLTSTTCIGVYEAAVSNVLKAKVGTLTPSTLALSWGTEYADTPTYSQIFYGATCPLDSTHIAILYQYLTGGTTNEWYGMILTEAAGVITYSGSPGANTNIPSSANFGRGGIALLDSTHVIASVVDNSSGDVKAIAGSISGTTITWGSAVTLKSGTNNTPYTKITALDSTHAVAVYDDIQSPYVQYAVAMTISGTTITAGAEYEVFSSTSYGGSNSYECNVVKLDSTHFFHFFNGYISSSENYGAVGTISGDSITNMTDSVELFSVTLGNCTLAALDSNKVAIGRATPSSAGTVRPHSVYVENNGEHISSVNNANLDTSAYGSAVAAFDNNYIVFLSNLAPAHTGWGYAPFQDTMDGTYFTIDDPTTSYYVWFDLDNLSADPTPGGTGIEVDVTSADSAATVASAIQTAVNAETDFGASVSTDIVTITNANGGSVTDAGIGTSLTSLWVTEQGTSAVDPAPGGTGIQVDVTPGSTANTIASDIQTAINAETDFSASVLTDTVTVTNANVGAPNSDYGVFSNLTLNTTTIGVDASVDPSVSLRTGIQVNYTAEDTANTIAGATQTAVNGHASFSASVLTDTVTVTSAATGVRNSRSESNSVLSPLRVTTTGTVASTDPAPGGTGIAVIITPENDQTEMLTGTQSAINAVGDFSAELIAKSEIGIDWTSETPAGGFSSTFYGITNPKSTAQHGTLGRYAAVGASAEIQTSADGVTWTQRTADASYTGTFYDVGHGYDIQLRSMYVAVGQNREIQISADGIEWVRKNNDVSGSLKSIASDNANIFVAVGDSGDIQTSIDYCESWAAQTPPASYTGNYTGVVFEKELFLAVGATGALHTSPDGITWTARTPDASFVGTFTKATYGNGIFVAVGADQIQTSPDAITWTQRTPAGTTPSFNSVVFGEGLFTAVGSNGDGQIQTSPYGTTWTIRTSAGSYAGDFNDIDFGDQGLITIGTLGEIQKSEKSEAQYIEIKNASTGIAAAPDIGDSSAFAMSAIVGTAAVAANESTDPAVAGKTGIKVYVDDGEFMQYYTSKIAANLIDQINYFDAVSNLSTVTVTNTDTGPTTDATTGDFTGISTIVVATQGRDFEAEYNSTDPAPAGKTAIETRFDEDDIALTINSKLTSSINSEPQFSAATGGGISEQIGIEFNSTDYSGQNSKYWTFDAPDGVGGTVGYYVWYNVNSGGSDPGPIGSRTGIQVIVGGKLSVSAFRTATTNAINASAGTYVTVTFAGASNNTRVNADVTGAAYAFENVDVEGLAIEMIIPETRFELKWFLSSTTDTSNVNGRYWTYDVPTGSGTDLFYVWYNANSTGIDPAISGRTGIEVSLSDPTGYTELLNNTRDTLNAQASYGVSASYVSITNNFRSHLRADTAGNVTNAGDGTWGGVYGVLHHILDGTEPIIGVEIYNSEAGDTAPDASDVDTGFTITTFQQGVEPPPLTDWDSIIVKLNAATSGGTWELYQEDVRLTSDSSGPTSTVRLGSGLSGANLFSNLTGFITFEEPKDPYPA